MKQDIVVLRLLLACAFEGVWVKRALLSVLQFLTNKQTHLKYFSHKLPLLSGWNA